MGADRQGRAPRVRGRASPCRSPFPPDERARRGRVDARGLHRGASRRSTAACAAIDDRSLEAFWAWEAYDEEGVRFGILRTTEQVADAAVEIAARRAEAGDAPSRAERILGRYLVAWRELWSVADRADAALDTPPLEGEWPLRTILDHLVEADLGFLVTIRNGLDQLRAGIAHRGASAPTRRGSPWPRSRSGPWRAAFAGSLDDIRSFHRAARDRIVGRLAGDDRRRADRDVAVLGRRARRTASASGGSSRTSASTRSRPRRPSRRRSARRARSSGCSGCWPARPATSRRRGDRRRRPARRVAERGARPGVAAGADELG